MLGGFITPAGCVTLNSELSIFCALAITSFLFFGAGQCVGGQYPSCGPMRFWSVPVSFSFLFSFPLSVRL